jgi:hypothetical protein
VALQPINIGMKESSHIFNGTVQILAKVQEKAAREMKPPENKKKLFSTYTVYR